MKFLLCVLAAAAAGVAAQDYVIKPPSMALLQPQGLRMSIPHQLGIDIFAVHYSVNKPVEGTAPGDFNEDITSPSGDEWVHENTEVVVNVGDIVYFWHYVQHRGLGYQLLNQQWAATDPTEPTDPPSNPPTDPPTNPPTDPSTPTPPPTSSTPGSSTPQPPTPPTAPPRKSHRKVHNVFKDRKYLRQAKRAPPPTSCEEYPCLIFEDNFDYFDLDTWEHETTAGGGGNWEFQYYHNNRTNSYVRDGHLYLRPTTTAEKYGEGFLSSGTLELWGHQPANLCTGNAWWGCSRAGTPTNFINPAQSARVRSTQSFNFRYGRMEIEARMPKGDWLWPAIWLLPKHDPYGGWPASGEIDIIESRGNVDLRDESGNQQGNTRAGAALHWGPYGPHNGYEMTNAGRDGTWADEFHRFTLDWDENSIKVSYDDVEVMNVVPPEGGFWEMNNFGLPDENNPWRHAGKMAPFDQEFYIIMNVAVGGTNGFFPDHWTNGGYNKPWNNESPVGPRDFWQGRNNWLPTWNGEESAMVINYVRVWKMQADAEMNEFDELNR